jgi:hypothetical protein
MSTVNQSSPLSELLDKLYLKQPYIHINSHASYRHWWENETRWLWYSYRWRTHEPTAKEDIHRLYPHLEEFKVKRKRYRSSWNRDWSKAKIVSHTEVLPTGEEITTYWPSEHGQWSRHFEPGFRVRYNKGVVDKKVDQVEDVSEQAYEIDRKVAKQEWTKRKTKEFRKNDKVTSNYYSSTSARKWAQIEDNRIARRKAKALIKSGEYESIPKFRGPIDKWKWD